MRKTQAARPIVLPIVPEAKTDGREAPPRQTPGLGIPATTVRPAPDRREPWKALRDISLRRFEKMLEIEPRILHDGDPGGVHDLRVASRRLQQSLKLLFPPPVSREIRSVMRSVRRSRAALSELRNDDVLLKHVRAVLGRKRTARRGAWNAVADHLAERRPQLLRKACRKLIRSHLSQTYYQLDEALGGEGPAKTRETHEAVAGRQSMEFASGVEFARNRAWDIFTARVEAASVKPSAGAIHRARIAVKRLRYLMEILHDLGGRHEEQPLVDLRRLQQILGEWHDREVLEAMMVETITERKLLRDDLLLAMELERLILRTRMAKQKLESRFFDWTRDPANIARITQWISGAGKRFLSEPSGEHPR